TERLHMLDAAVRGALHAPALNLDSNGELVEALEINGFTGFLTTETGARSASKLSLDTVLANDPVLRQNLAVRSHLATLTGTFLTPWLEIAEETGGTIHATYNSTRNPEGYGTRTGRLSSSKPNFQNVPGDLGDDLPVMRSYLLPDPGQVWISIDAKSQEPRIAAHFEDGALLKAYRENPALDPYQFIMERVGGGITRKQAKVCFLGLLYGMGAAKLGDQVGLDSVAAGSLRHAVRAALPDIAALDYACKRRFQQGAAVTTMGGRSYFCEPPSNGRTWEYKSLNTLIQGSAADQTKEALVYLHERLPAGCRILGTVHDEINISAPRECVEEISLLAQAAFNALQCDCPAAVTVGVGSTWAEAAK
ncbi:MAG: DNA polymerase, partial [Caldilineaceae bacterium]